MPETKVALSRSRRVLVVDDTPTVAVLIAMTIAQYGHEVRFVHSAGEALALMEEFAPEIVFSDLSMPVMHGCALARALRADPRYRDLVLVALTAYEDEEQIARALGAGFNRVLGKPPEIAGMEQILEMACGAE